MKTSIWVQIALALTALVSLANHCFAEDSKYGDPTRFEACIRAFEETDKQQLPPKGAIVFLGSSTIAGWSDLKEDLAPLTVIPRGFGGSNMSEALYYADRIVIPYAPRAVVIYEGDNDITTGISPELVRDTFCELVNKLHNQLPKTRVYFLSIKPSPTRWSFWPKTQNANSLIAKECQKSRWLTYIDITCVTLDSKGKPRAELFLEDGVHLNRKGYEVWRNRIKPILMEKERAAEAKNK